MRFSDHNNAFDRSIVCGNLCYEKIDKRTETWFPAVRLAPRLPLSLVLTVPWAGGKLASVILGQFYSCRRTLRPTHQ